MVVPHGLCLEVIHDFSDVTGNSIGNTRIFFVYKIVTIILTNNWKESKKFPQSKTFNLWYQTSPISTSSADRFGRVGQRSNTYILSERDNIMVKKVTKGVNFSDEKFVSRPMLLVFVRSTKSFNPTLLLSRIRLLFLYFETVRSNPNVDFLR